MAEFVVDYHIPSRQAGVPEHPYIDEGLPKWGRPDLVHALKERDVDVVFSRGTPAFDFETGKVLALKPSFKMEGGVLQVEAIPHVMAINAIGAIRNTSKVLGHDVPELNHPAVRAAARDKAVTNDILESIGLAKAFGLYANNSLDTVLDNIPGQAVVLKPRTGMQSKGIAHYSKALLVEAEKRGELDGQDWVIEERLAFTPAIPIQGIDAEQQAIIEAANKQGLPKELRIHSFGRDQDGALLTSIVLRVAGNGDSDLSNDDWVYIDPASVPAALLEQNDQAVSAFEQYTGVREMHVAIDWAWAVSASNADPHWVPMEVNGSEPQLVFSSENSAVARHQTGLLADQLVRIAHMTQRGERIQS
jgi:hypothetical protein